MDSTTQANEHQWDQLSKKGVLCSQPRTNLEPSSAFAYLNQRGFYHDPNGFLDQRILCLASGGGQQSIAFALLGAKVSVIDFSAEQLSKDQEAATACGVDIEIIKSDMRDLSHFAHESFDLVYQPYSINYIPDPQPVFDEVARILKPGGHYDLMLHNPYAHGTWKDGCWGKEWEKEELWQGKGYPVWQPYQDGYPIQTDDPHWNFWNDTQEKVKIPSPQEYRHTLSTVLNLLIGRGFNLKVFKEEKGTNFTSEPGTWEHYQSCLPPWLYLFCQKL